MGLKAATVDPASDRVSGIGGVGDDHGGPPVVFKQDPILVQEARVGSLQNLPPAVWPEGPYQDLRQEPHKLVAFVWLQAQKPNESVHGVAHLL